MQRCQLTALPSGHTSCQFSDQRSIGGKHEHIAPRMRTKRYRAVEPSAPNSHRPYPLPHVAMSCSPSSQRATVENPAYRRHCSCIRPVGSAVRDLASSRPRCRWQTTLNWQGASLMHNSGAAVLVIVAATVLQGCAQTGGWFSRGSDPSRSDSASASTSRSSVASRYGASAGPSGIGDMPSYGGDLRVEP